MGGYLKQLGGKVRDKYNEVRENYHTKQELRHQQQQQQQQQQLQQTNNYYSEEDDYYEEDKENLVQPNSSGGLMNGGMYANPAYDQYSSRARSRSMMEDEDGEMYYKPRPFVMQQQQPPPPQQPQRPQPHRQQQQQQQQQFWQQQQQQQQVHQPVQYQPQPQPVVQRQQQQQQLRPYQQQTAAAAPAPSYTTRGYFCLSNTYNMMYYSMDETPSAPPPNADLQNGRSDVFNNKKQNCQFVPTLQHPTVPVVRTAKVAAAPTPQPICYHQQPPPSSSGKEIAGGGAPQDNVAAITFQTPPPPPAAKQQKQLQQPPPQQPQQQQEKPGLLERCKFWQKWKKNEEDAYRYHTANTQTSKQTQAVTTVRTSNNQQQVKQQQPKPQPQPQPQKQQKQRQQPQPQKQQKKDTYDKNYFKVNREESVEQRHNIFNPAYNDGRAPAYTITYMSEGRTEGSWSPNGREADEASVPPGYSITYMSESRAEPSSSPIRRDGASTSVPPPYTITAINDTDSSLSSQRRGGGGGDSSGASYHCYSLHPNSEAARRSGGGGGRSSSARRRGNSAHSRPSNTNEKNVYHHHNTQTQPPPPAMTFIHKSQSMRTPNDSSAYASSRHNNGHLNNSNSNRNVHFDPLADSTISLSPSPMYPAMAQVTFAEDNNTNNINNGLPPPTTSHNGTYYYEPGQLPAAPSVPPGYTLSPMPTPSEESRARASGSGGSLGPATLNMTGAPERRHQFILDLINRVGPLATCALYGNAFVETGGTFDPQQRQLGPGGNAIGLFQMCPAMKRYFDGYCAEYEAKHQRRLGGLAVRPRKGCGATVLDPMAAESQLTFVLQELMFGVYIGGGNARKIRDAFYLSDFDPKTEKVKVRVNFFSITQEMIEDAAEVFCELFERPSVPHMDRRKRQALNCMEYIKLHKLHIWVME